MTTRPDSDSSTATSNSAFSIEYRDVAKVFGTKRVVDDLSFEVDRGEFFALLGPSGCGKTTTLRILGGFEDVTSGQVLLDGVDITWMPPHRRNVNTVFQSYALFPHLNVFENVAFGLRRHHVDDKKISSLVSEHLELVGLSGFEKRPSTKLSGGQQQRVALARALVNHPRVLLLDEPMGALDAKIRQVMRIELKKIQREVGITFLYVTHDQEEAMSLGDRVAVMRDGRFEDLGTPQRVYDRPATEYVADFLGDCNFIPVDNATNPPLLPGGARADVAEDTVVKGAVITKIGVRPEKLQLRPRENTSSTAVRANEVDAVVIASTYLGASTRHELDTNFGVVLGAVVQSSGTEVRVAPGDHVTVSWHREHCFALSDSASPS